MAELLRFAAEVRLELSQLGNLGSRSDTARLDAALQKWLVDVCEEHVDEVGRNFGQQSRMGPTLRCHF